jgi:hypothetical protein
MEGAQSTFREEGERKIRPLDKHPRVAQSSLAWPAPAFALAKLYFAPALARSLHNL